MDKRAEESAAFLANEVWAKRDGGGGAADEKRPRERYPKLVVEELGISLVRLTEEELAYAVRRPKRRKAPGPDEIPIEFFKEVNDDNRKKVLEILNLWWEEESVPEEALRARVVLIYKNGDTGI